jgi:mono/diheme cytochrome c family protein
MRHIFIKRIFIISFLSLPLGLGWHLGAGGGPGARSAARAAAPDGPSPALKSARRHYRQYCARCHGGDYTGRGAWRGRGIPDFTSGPWHEGRTDVELVVSILEGKGTQMPAFTGQLNEEQARDLVLLIRRAKPARPTTPEAGPTDFTRRYASLYAELEELRKQYRELARTPRTPEPRCQGSGIVIPVRGGR